MSSAAFAPWPYKTSTAERYRRSRSVGALAARSSLVGAYRASAANAASVSFWFHSGCVYVIVSPQYAIAKSGSISWAFRNASAA